MKTYKHVWNHYNESENGLHKIVTYYLEDVSLLSSDCGTEWLAEQNIIQHIPQHFPTPAKKLFWHEKNVRVFSSASARKLAKRLTRNELQSFLLNLCHEVGKKTLTRNVRQSFLLSFCQKLRKLTKRFWREMNVRVLSSTSVRKLSKRLWHEMNVRVFCSTSVAKLGKWLWHETNVRVFSSTSSGNW